MGTVSDTVAPEFSSIVVAQGASPMAALYDIDTFRHLDQRDASPCLISVDDSLRVAISGEGANPAIRVEVAVAAPGVDIPQGSPLASRSWGVTSKSGTEL